MKQAMPAAVSDRAGTLGKPAHPVMHARPTRRRRRRRTRPRHPPRPYASCASRRAGQTRRRRSRVVACSGIFGKDSSHLQLAMTYETKNIAFTDVDANGGTKVPASVLFPNDPKRRLEVWWSNPADRSDTYLIVINGKSTWTAPGGMKLGLNLAQLEKLNHKPFKLKGFDKDGVATVSDWDGGALADLPGGCKSGMSLHRRSEGLRRTRSAR